MKRKLQSKNDGTSDRCFTLVPRKKWICWDFSTIRWKPHQKRTTATCRHLNKKVGYRPRFCQFPFGSRTIPFFVFGETDRSDITLFFSTIFFLDLNEFLVACYATLFVTMLVSRLVSVCLSVCLLVGWSVGWSVGRSVSWSVHLSFCI